MEASEATAEGLTEGEIASIPLLDSMRHDGKIASNVFTFNNCGKDASVTFGGVDTSLASGDINYAPVTKTFGKYYGYWMAEGMDVKIDGESVVSEASELNTYGGVIIDTGTTLNYLPTAVVSGLKKVLEEKDSSLSTSFFEWESCVSKEVVKDLPDLSYYFAGSNGTFPVTLSASEYLLAYDDCYYWGFESSDLTIFGNIGMMNKLVIFDKENTRIGFATSDCDSTEEEDVAIKPRSPVEMIGAIADQARSHSASDWTSFVMIAAGVAMTVLGVGFTVVKVLTRTEAKVQASKQGAMDDESTVNQNSHNSPYYSFADIGIEAA